MTLTNRKKSWYWGRKKPLSPIFLKVFLKAMHDFSYLLRYGDLSVRISNFVLPDHTPPAKISIPTLRSQYQRSYEPLRGSQLRGDTIFM